MRKEERKREEKGQKRKRGKWREMLHAVTYTNGNDRRLMVGGQKEIGMEIDCGRRKWLEGMKRR